MIQKPYKYVVRLPMELRERIVEAAHRYRRSINSEIVARLEHSFGEGAEADIAPPLHPHLEHVLRNRLDAVEQSLINGFRLLERKKREALLQLLN